MIITITLNLIAAIVVAFLIGMALGLIKIGQIKADLLHLYRVTKLKIEYNIYRFKEGVKRFFSNFGE